MQECLQALPPNESKKQNKQPKNEVYTERGSPMCLREEGKTSLKKKFLYAYFNCLSLSLN
jgi:hypothetical protein